jgi:hypothetical protein
VPEGHGEGYGPEPVSDVRADGKYQRSIVSESNPCTVRLKGPADPATGLRYLREISVGDDSPPLSCHARRNNSSGHDIRWSMRSVRQYDTTDSPDPENDNPDFWAFAAVNPPSAYADGYRVRNGLAADPSYGATRGSIPLDDERGADRGSLSDLDIANLRKGS